MDLLRSHRQTSNRDNVTSPLASQVDAIEINFPDEKNSINESEIRSAADEFSDFIDEEALTEGEVSVSVASSKPIHKQPNHETMSVTNNTWLRQCSRHIQAVFEQAEQHQACNIQALAKHIQQLLTRLENDHEQHMMDALELNISQQTQHIRERHQSLGGLIQKSILMMLYTIKTGKQLQLSSSDLHMHTLASMLHHSGMAQVSNDIRNKKARLNKKELNEIRQAASRGVDFLKLSNINDAVILDACLFANERYDGSGTTGLSGSSIAWSARLTGVLSMFEALIHYRPYRNRLLPRDAIREMVKNHKKAFDPDMLKALIESISLYPIGTYAQLNTGEIGLVTHIHPYRPLRPVVEIRMDRHGHAIPPRKIDLTTQPNLTVEHCMYEEATLELANQHQ
ncbi:MAG: hypothetical protein Q9M18_04790 [Mariprofundaceae bacterium]|nr:hypothetical protein [Mariprofundaceae bacterium]